MNAREMNMYGCTLDEIKEAARQSAMHGWRGNANDVVSDVNIDSDGCR